METINTTPPITQSLPADVDFYFKGVEIDHFEEKVFKQWIKSRFTETVLEHTTLIAQQEVNMLKLAQEAYFKKLSHAYSMAISRDTLEHSNVIAIIDRIWLSVKKIKPYHITFYICEMGGEIVDVNCAGVAEPFKPECSFADQIVQHLTEQFPDKYFELVPYRAASNVTRAFLNKSLTAKTEIISQ